MAFFSSYTDIFLSRVPDTKQISFTCYLVYLFTASETFLTMAIWWQLALLLGHELCSAQQTQIATILLPNDIINSATTTPTAFTGSATSSAGTTAFKLDCNNLNYCGNSLFQMYKALSFGASRGTTTFNLQTE